MYYWEDDTYVIIPISYNIFYRESLKNKRHISFAREFSITDGFLEELKKIILMYESKKTIAIDMERVNYHGKMFEDFRNTQQRIVFFNVRGETLRNEMQEDLPSLAWNDDETICLLNGMISEDILCDYKTKFNLTYKKLYSKILNSIKDSCENGKPLLLDSSGLYSNIYITVKKLFLVPKDYYFVLYGMAMEVEKFGEFDSFISSSKNGAILANLLGNMLNKKVVHIHGVGPKYSMKFGNMQNEIKRGKTYVYVFDFICTGTELKVMSALINSNDAYLVGGIGFAKYDSQDREDSFFYDKIKCLITTDEAGIQYKIAGDKADILKLMKDER